MRRPVPTVPISPQQLKHFAAATVAITGLLAMFASGEGGGLSDDLQARAAQNKLAQTEASKLGTTQLKAHVKLKNNGKAHFAFSEGGEVVDMSAEWGSGSSGGGGAVAPRPNANPTVMRPKLPKNPGESVTIAGAEGLPDAAKPESQRAKKVPPKKAEAKPFNKPSEQDLDKALEASRQRSGAADTDDY